MVEALSTAVSGLVAASKKADAAAANIANASTPDYQPIEARDTAQQAGPLSPAGVQAEYQHTGGQDVDIAAEAVNLTLASSAYKANAAVIKVVNENDETLRKALDTDA